MKFKRAVTSLIVLCMMAISSSAFAEQGMASEYRNILNGSTFCVEYDDGYYKVALSEQNNNRIYYSAMGAALGYFSLFGEPSKDPRVVFLNGKYYQFDDIMDRRHSIMATALQINDENIDPRENWDSVRLKLSLPSALRPLITNDRFNDELSNIPVPSYVDSGTYTDKKGKKYDFDKYVSTVKNKAGNAVIEKIYYLYYQNEELKVVKLSNKLLGDDKEFVETVLKNVKISNVIPPKYKVEIPKSTKVYSAGIGDMDDLIDQPPLLEEYK